MRDKSKPTQREILQAFRRGRHDAILGRQMQAYYSHPEKQEAYERGYRRGRSQSQGVTA